MASKRLVLFTLLFLLLASSFAVGQGTSGTISGTVLDPQGAVVPGAAVTIKNLDTGLLRQAAWYSTTARRSCSSASA